MGVYLDVLQVSGVWKHCKYIIFVLRASLSVFISFLSHLRGEGEGGGRGLSVLGANLLIELLCWEVNQGLQSIKSTTISFPIIPFTKQKLRTIPYYNIRIVLFKKQG